MKRILNKILQVKSLESLLVSYLEKVDRGKLDTLSAREMIQMVSRSIGVTEDFLMRDIAKRSGVQFHERNSSELFTDLIFNERNLAYSSRRDLYLCLDPRAALNLSGCTSKSQIVLTTPLFLQQSLETQFSDSFEILRQILKHVHDADNGEILIRKRDLLPVYTFIGNGGRPGEGRLSEGAYNKLRKFDDLPFQEFSLEFLGKKVKVNVSKALIQLRLSAQYNNILVSSERTDRSVLILIKDIGLRALIEHAFSEAEMQVEVYPTVSQGLRMLKNNQQSYCAVVSDVAGELLKNAIDVEANEVPILLLVDTPSDMAELSLLRRGFIDVVVKNKDPEIVVERIKRVMR